MGGTDTGAAARTADGMQTRFLPSIEAQLGTLIEAITEAGAPPELTKRVFEASEQIHYGRLTDDEQLHRLLVDIVRATKPPVLTSAWEEASLKLEELSAEEAGEI